MFDPKITEGPWQNESEYKVGPLTARADCGEPYICEESSGDVQAILAVPQLLEVYKAAKAYGELRVDHPNVMERARLAAELEIAILELEEKHCDSRGRMKVARE